MTVGTKPDVTMATRLVEGVWGQFEGDESAEQLIVDRFSFRWTSPLCPS